ncbi:chemotaxis protein CheW [Oscillatoriales cyanobacterium USR001]|nr:chemotaxis protein CheW [Oscillatoriales cyanobacterium USR001]
MQNQPYLIFEHNGFIYGLAAAVVQEIFFLPELTPIPESPPDIVGVINLRGEILPVMDLNLRFGYHAQEYCLTDSLIVIESKEFRIGIVVNQVQEVENISTEVIKTQLSYGREQVNKSSHFVSEIAQIDTGIVMLLNPETLIQYSQEKSENIQRIGDVKHQKNEEVVDQKITFADVRYFPAFCPNATPQEKAIFQERANNLKRQNSKEDLDKNKLPIAIIAFNGEYFGLNLEAVREFTDIRKVTPIPCTPDYVIGNMNLRGEIVTLIDIRTALNMSISVAGELSKAIVVQISDLVAGIVADQVLDVMYLNISEITAIPTALHSTNDEYLKGTAPYREKMMSILDLHKILTKGALVVDEEV